MHYTLPISIIVIIHASFIMCLLPSGQDVAPSPLVPDDSQLLQKPSSKHSLVVPDRTQWTFPLLDTKSEDYEKLKIRLCANGEICLLVHFLLSVYE